VPQFTATQTLSPTEQALLDLTNQTKLNLGNLGVDASAKLSTLLGTDFNVDKATEDKIDALGAARLDPQFAKNEDALRTRLTNQGIQPGSAAWNAEMTQFQQGKNDAYNQLYLSGNNQAFQQALAQRDLPINEISALMSGSQVSQPNFVSTPSTNVAGVDYTGLVNNNYNQQMQQYNTQMAQNNAMMGGLFGLGSAAAYGYAKSDRRLKSNIQRVGTLPNGLALYDYTIFDQRERGVMADEVEKVFPTAVLTAPDGFKMVDYSQLGIIPELRAF